MSITREQLKVGELYVYDGDVRTVLIITEKSVVYQNKCTGKEYLWSIRDFLKGHTLIPKQPKTETLYECLSSCGNTAWYFNDGSYPVFAEKRKHTGISDNINRKTGRTLELNMDTWEII